MTTAAPPNANDLPDIGTIPDDADGLREILEDDSKREKVFATKQGQLAFLAAYAQAQDRSGKLGKQVAEHVATTVQDILKEYGGAERPDQSNVTVQIQQGPTTWSGGILPDTSRWKSSVMNAMHNPEAAGAPLDGTYKNIGQMALDVHAHSKGRNVKHADAWAKVLEVTNAYSENDPATGGFLVPEEMRAMIMSLAMEQSIMRSRATVITMNSLTTAIPYVDATTHVGSVFGGMVFYWVGESTPITRTEARFGRVKLEANKLVGGAAIPNELYADATALTAWLNVAAPQGISFYEDVAFISGNGVGQPLGFRNGEALVRFDRASAGAIAPGDIFGMYATMLPQSLGNAVWLCNQTALPQIFSLALSVGTGGAPINILDVTAGPRLSLLGRPLIVTEKLPAIGGGNVDDIMFIDPTYYLLGDRQGVSLDYSEHSRFNQDETELRIIERVDGRPWIQSPLTPLNGTNLSPFVGITAS